MAVLELAVRLRQFVVENGLGHVRIAPLPVRSWPGKIREPDIFFISSEQGERIHQQVCGIPDLVVEVTSAATARADRMEKLQEYARAGVREYWIVDPDARTVKVYSLEGGRTCCAADAAREKWPRRDCFPAFRYPWRPW